MTNFEPKEMGSPEWWQIVMSSPMYEAEALLKRYRAKLLEETAGDPAQCVANAQIHRVNAEIHRFAQVQNRARLTQAIRNVCGNEVASQVMEEAARLESIARAEIGVPAC